MGPEVERKKIGRTGTGNDTGRDWRCGLSEL